MFLFPLIYIGSFLVSFKELLHKNKQAILVFFFLGLPIYTTAMSIALKLGFSEMVSVFQPLKEIIVLTALSIFLWNYKGKFKPQFIDWAVLSYFCYTFLYVLLPIGNLGFVEKAISFKSTSFFALVYLAGRLLNVTEIYLSKYFQLYLVVILASSAVLIGEIVTDTHLQTLSGYADFNFYLYNQEPSGDYGLTWTFGSANGFKRFASFFANPLEYAAAILLALSIIAGLYTNQQNKFKPNKLGLITFITTQFSILFSVSRAALGSYLIMIFFYALITKNKLLIKGIYLMFSLGVVYFFLFLFVVNPDIYELIYETATFNDPSSVGHVVAWLNGFEAIANNPLGMGLGSSGVLAESSGGGTGGENQYIIIGVQTGLISLAIYLTIHFYFIGSCWKWFNKLKLKDRKICLTLLLIKIGFIIPMMTSELESSALISYINWFLSGLFVTIISKQITAKGNPDPNENPNFLIIKGVNQ